MLTYITNLTCAHSAELYSTRLQNTSADMCLEPETPTWIPHCQVFSHVRSLLRAFRDTVVLAVKTHWTRLQRAPTSAPRW